MRFVEISVIIINYNTLDLTRYCVESVINHSQKINLEVIIVDNNSKEEGVEMLKDLFPQIKLIKSPVNLGFAGGNNLGIKQATGKYILLLNSDTYLNSDVLFDTWQYMEQHPKVGVISPRLIYPDGRHQSVAQRFPSVRYQIIELLRLQKVLPRRVAGRVLLGSFFNHRETVKADWVWGAFFLFRSEILPLLPAKQLDESYFMYCEDMQWCLDFSRLGYETHYYAGAEIIHLMGGSSANKSKLNQESRMLFLQKNYNCLHRKAILLLEKLLQ